jgi:hypothetical protein
MPDTGIPMLGRVSCGSMQISSKKIMIFGGENATGPKNDTYVLNCDNHSITPLKEKLPRPCTLFLHNKLLVLQYSFAFIDAESEEIFEYCKKTKKWRTIEFESSLPH